MKGTFRASMAWLHTGLGLITGWVLFAIALSGTLSVFRESISTWMRPELPTAPVQTIDATAHAVAWLTDHAPKSPAWYLAVPTHRAPYVFGTWEKPGGSYIQKALNPLTGSPDGIRDTRGGEFFYRFHFELQLPYPYGRLIAAVAALALVVALVTGLIIHRRIFADFFTFRPNKGQRSWLDAHNLLGVIAFPFHLMISFTGAVTLVTMLLPWGPQAVYKQDIMAGYTDLNPAIETRPASGKPGHLTSVLPVLREAEKRFKGAGISQVYIYNPSDAASLITVMAGNNGTISTLSHSLTFDGTTGLLMREHVETRPAVRTYTFLYGLHIARFTPDVTRWLYFISGLMLTAVIGSGMRLWTVKRLRLPHHLGHVLTDRLNVGVLAGAPLAFASYFLANRLLPPMSAHRADHEVQCVFIVWGLALVFALVRPARRTWPEMLTACALACFGIAAMSSPWTNPVTQSTALVSLLFSGAFGYTASRSLNGKAKQT